LFSREKGIAFDFTEKGVFKPEVEPTHVIPTIAHEPWQVANFRVPKALEGEVIEIIRKKLECGALERCCGPYRNHWFLVPKKDKGYRLINAAQRLNAITIKDASLPPSAEEYSEDFAGFPVLSSLDLFSGYDQMALAEICRHLIAFQTPLGLLRMTTLPQGYTNGVQVFDSVIKKILKDQISAKQGKPFINGVGVKPPTRSLFLDSRGKPINVAPGIRRYILEAIVSIDKVMADIERAGGTISGAKSEFLMEQLKIVAYVCRMDGRSTEETKTRKITNWPPCIDLSDVRAFLGLSVYYRIWIKHFSTIAEPLFRLSRKDMEFYWLEEQQIAMDELKKALTSAPALNPIDYESDGKILLSMDSSLAGWGAILQQEEPKTGKRHPARFESGICTEAKKKYDAGKLECRGLLKALKKLRMYLYGVRFLVEIDAMTLVHQLNQPASDLPGSVVNRWLAWIRMFSFEIKHVAGKRHRGPDGLSRRRRSVEDSDEEEGVEELEEEMDADLAVNEVDSEEEGNNEDEIEEDDDQAMPDEIKKVTRYLTTLQRPANMTDKQFDSFRQYAL